MAPPLDINGICTGLGDEAMQQLCRETLAGCEGSWTSDPSRTYCTQQATSCSAQKKQGQSSFRLVMPNQGVVEVNSPSDCFQTAVRITGVFWPQDYKEPAKKPAAQSPAAEKPAASMPSDPGGEATCREAGEPGTPAFLKCLELVGICRQTDTGGYQLPLGNQSIFVANQVGCLIMAPRVARAQFASSSPDDQKPAAAGAVQGLAPFRPDGKRLFGVGFAQAGFRPQITADTTSKKLLLIAKCDGARKFIPIDISYRIAAAEGGRYRMTYTITKGGTAVGGEETIELLAGDGQHLDERLAFGITLNGEGSFDSISSVKIVKLAE